MQKKQIILSYDYELFFGDHSGTVKKSIIDPTNELLDAMESVGLVGNFFIDWQMLKFIQQEKDYQAQKDYELLVNQIKDIVKRGHRIELHIHPHWVDAKYKGKGLWDFSDFSHYCLNSFPQEKITKMIVEGTEMLTSIAREVDPKYRIVAFRAGGWAIQPFSLLKEGFEKAGIVIDSSPSRGFYLKNSYSFCDFRSIPKKSVYSFNDDVCKEDITGKFVCVPITSYKKYFIYRLIEKIYRELTDNLNFVTDGTHARRCDQNSDDTKEKRTKVVIRMLSFYMCPIILPFVFLSLRKWDLLCSIQHPKDHTKNTTKIIRMFARRVSSITYEDLLYLNK